MGKNNKARRAAKAKKRANDRRQSGQGGSGWSGSDNRSQQNNGPMFSEQELAEYYLALAVLDGQSAKTPTKNEALDELDKLRPSAVTAEAERMMATLIGKNWESGWQPAELLRRGRSEASSAATGRLIALAIASDNAGRRATTLDSQWMTQIDRLDLPAVDGHGGWVSRWITTEGLAWSKAVRGIIDAIRVASSIPHLETLIPPPGSSRTGSAWPKARRSEKSAGADPVLEKIRNLLAKAESSEFEAEAAAFTGKAQQLMTRHAIDAATVERGTSDPDEAPIMIRVMIDPPYVDAKAVLLHVVAEANRCRAVTLSGLDMVSVVGFDSDLAAVEMLFTSLLVQAQSAMTDAARRAPAGTRVRSQAYRSSFLAGFANRIGDRLDEINAHVFNEAEAEVGSRFQLVLRDRSATVEDAFNDWFGDLTRKGVRGGYDHVGRASGQVAADQAQLGFGDLSDARNASDIDLTNAIDLTGIDPQSAIRR